MASARQPGMPRRPRMDEPGSWHHVVNRSVAKRPLFETRSDFRHFLAWLARQVRQRRLEIHSYCLMTTHFHMLVRSPSGQMSEALRRAQNEHSRRFNRLRRRDGPLIRGRFFSRRVDTDEYRCAVVRYIDANPVRAGIARAAGEYEFGSAAAYLRAKGPPWLTRSWIEATACAVSGSARFDAAAYRAAFDPGVGASFDALHELVESRMRARVRTAARENLVAAAPAHARSWMRWKSRLADGLEPGMPICTPEGLRRALAANCAQHGAWMVEDGRSVRRGQELARFGLLHELCGRSWMEIARMERVSKSQALHLGQLHQRIFQSDAAYAVRVYDVGRAAVLLMQPTAGTPGEAFMPDGGRAPVRHDRS